jgi:hypothetical protein
VCTNDPTAAEERLGGAKRRKGSESSRHEYAPHSEGRRRCAEARLKRPCGDILDRNIPLMFKHFERRYTYLEAVMPPAEECLLVPFYVAGRAVGTIWAISHDDRRKFDAEDMRQLVSLGRFASSAYQAVESLGALERESAKLRDSELRYRRLFESAKDAASPRSSRAGADRPPSDRGELPWSRSFPSSHASIACRCGTERIRPPKASADPGALRRPW